MAEQINYAQLYAEGTAQKFKEGQKSIALYERGEGYKVLGGKIIQIPTLSVTGYRPHRRGTGLQEADGFDNAWVPKTLDYDRSKHILVDPLDIEETNMARSVANFTNVFITEHKIPEIDAYTFSKLYSEFVAASKTATRATLTEANVLETFDNLMLEFDNNEVPTEGRILYATPLVKSLLKKAEGLTRFFNTQDGTAGVQRNIYSLDDVEIVTVPASRMKTAYDFDLEDGGFKPLVDAEQIQMILVHPKAQVSYKKLEEAFLDEPSAKSNGKYNWFEHTYGGTFLVPNKEDGIAFVLPKTGEPETGEPETGEPETGEPETGEPETGE